MNDIENCLEEISEYSERQVINPLLSFLLSSDENIKQHAITAIGFVVKRLADRDIESARVVMRRLILSLTDESGGIGWGAPEAMGEIMARHEKLADEYHKILISYLDPVGNFLEHEPLQKGALWGIGRLAHARPHLAKDANDLLKPFLESQDPEIRKLAADAHKAVSA